MRSWIHQLLGRRDKRPSVRRGIGPEAIALGIACAAFGCLVGLAWVRGIGRDCPSDPTFHLVLRQLPSSPIDAGYDIIIDGRCRVGFVGPLSQHLRVRTRITEEEVENLVALLGSEEVQHVAANDGIVDDCRDYLFDAGGASLVWTRFGREMRAFRSYGCRGSRVTPALDKVIIWATWAAGVADERMEDSPVDIP